MASGGGKEQVNSNQNLYFEWVRRDLERGQPWVGVVKLPPHDDSGLECLSQEGDRRDRVISVKTLSTPHPTQLLGGQ